MRRILQGLAALVLFLPPALPATAGDVVVRGDVVHTMAGESIRDGVVVVRDGKIAAVGTADTVPIPDGVEVLRAAVVTPGLVDAHTVVGLAGQYNYDHDQDQLEPSEPLQPELRAIDAYNAQERLVEWVREFGVTTIHTGHAPGEVISGQTMIAKTRGATADDAALRETAMVACTLSSEALKQGKKSPGTRGRMVALLRQALVDAQAYRDGGDDEDGKPRARDLRKEVLVRVLDGEIPMLVTAQRAQDIASALRLADEFGFRLVLDGAAEAYRVIDQIQAARVPVILHPTMIRANGDAENMSFETAAKLADAGIRVALQSGYEDYVPKTRIILYEAGWAAANGLGFDRALASITIDAARILHMEHRVGSLEVGKDGDIALYDGDPFEYTSHCIGVVIEGDVVSRTVR